ncbi:MAG TPA: hypothetical protein VKK31_22240 [Thermoanaerobaculia bacterium]|nr:hypothetical protein [Thermoanaerobaculia bacterium]
MMKRLTAPSLLLASLLVPAAFLSAPAKASADVRYCCTTQQIQSCAAVGGTSTCRPDNICRCLF